MNDDLVSLKKMVGGYAFRALLRGKPLLQWRMTSPHNWFIEASRPGDYLWHSWDGEHPDLRLFDRVSDSKEKIMQYFGPDSGMSRLTLYVLKDVLRQHKGE